MKTFKNLTPHDITIVLEGKSFTIPKTGVVARVTTNDDISMVINDEIPVVVPTFGEVVDLPDPEDGVVFLVSRMVRSALSHRPDVVCPDTGPRSVVRDSDGRIVGVKRLSY